MLPSGRFHDQSIHGSLGKTRTFLQRAVFKIHIARVKYFLSIPFDRHADGSENMSGIVKSRPHRPSRIQVKRPLEITRFEAVFDVIQLAVLEKRVFGDAMLDAFRLHHVHRVVQHRAGEFGGFRRQKHLRLPLTLQENRQSSDMVEVRMSDDNRVHTAGLKEFIMWHSLRSLMLGVHARVQHDLRGLGFK